MMETYYRILKHGADGKLVKDSGLLPSRSYVIQFLELVGAFFTGGNVEATDTSGAEAYIWADAHILENIGNVKAAAEDDTYGIVVGTNAGTSAEDNEDHALDTKILHSGIGAANKLNYQAVTTISAREVGANVDMDITRTFINETGGNITVKEIGLIVKQVSVIKYHLMLRDVVADELVADAETLTVIYTLRTTA